MNTVVRAESLIHRNLTYLFVDKHIQEDAAFLEGGARNLFESFISPTHVGGFQLAFFCFSNS